MLNVNLILTDYLTGKKKGDEGMFNAAGSVKKLLEQIDFKAETVPENNKDMLTRLLTSLKGGPLDKFEIQMINEIIDCK